MRNIETRHLRYFIAVAEEGSIIAASRALNITQPALSRQIRDLEGNIGVPLFERHAKGVQLTEAGLSYLQDAKQSLLQLEQARDRAHRIAQGQTGSFKLGIMPSYLASPVTLAILEHFRERNPEILLSIEPLLGEPDLAISSGCDVYLQSDGVKFSCSQLDAHDITPRSLLMRRTDVPAT